MFHTQLVSSLLKGMHHPKAVNVLSLTPGQVITGEVKRILPDQSAIVKFGSMDVHAKLEAPLIVGQRSWFQVQPVSQPITLKVLQGLDQRQPASEKNISSLLQVFGLKEGKREEQLLRFFLQEKLPISKTNLQESLQIMKQLGTSEKTLQSLQVALIKGWPLTSETTQAVRSFLFEPSLQQKIAELTPLLPSERQVRELQTLNTPFNQEQLEKPNLLRSLFQLLGLENEKQLSIHFRGFEKLDQQLQQLPQQQLVLQQNIKIQLQQLMLDTTLSNQAKEKAESLITHITGQQLFMNVEGSQGQVQHLLFQLPFSFNKQLETLYGQIEGRKNDKGQIDPDNCRLLFYLQLPALGETCVDVHIRAKMISISLYNEGEHKAWLQELKPSLNGALEKLGYSLTSLVWKEANASTIFDPKNQKRPLYLQGGFKGVDIRI
jgi:hypothetical protein